MEPGVCRVQYSAKVGGRALPGASVRDRPLENSPLLEFVCSMWSAVSPGGWGAFRRTRRVHLKYLNGLILSIESPRAQSGRGRRDNINSAEEI